jgi:hypothetical protein
MRNTRKSFSRAHKFGARRRAIVETLKNGLASVRLIGTNAPMTNLSVVGTGIEEGDVVFVEYGGVRPVVKPSGAIENTQAIGIGLGGTMGESGESLREDAVDLGARVYCSTDTIVPHNTWTLVEYDTIDWDTDNLWTPALPGRLTAPSVGFYLVLFHWSWEKTGYKDYKEWGASSGGTIHKDLFQDWKPNQIRIVHSVHGEVYRTDDYKPFYDKMDTKDSLMFSVHAETGDYITAEVITTNSYSESRTLVGSNLYPRLTMQFRSYD